MIEPKKSLGGTSDYLSAQLLPGTKSPSIVIFSKKTSLCLWNPKTRTNLALLEEVNTFPQTTSIIRISRIPFSREILILTGLFCGKILIWKIDLSKISIKFSWYSGHSFKISCIQISNKDSWVLSGCLQGSVILWDLLENKGIFRNKTAHHGEIKCLEFLIYKPNQISTVVSYGVDNLLKIWDINSGACLKIIEMGIEPFLEIKIQQNKNLLLALNRNGEIISFNIMVPFILKYSGKVQGKKVGGNPKLLYDLNQSILILNNGVGVIDVFISKKQKNNDQTSLGKSKKNFGHFYSNVIMYHFKNKTNGLTLWKGKNMGNWIILLHNLETYILDFFHLSFKKKINGTLDVSIQRIFKRKIDSHLGEVRALLWFSRDKFLITLCNSVNLIYVWDISLQKCIKNFKLRTSYIAMEYFDNSSIVLGSKTGNIDLYEISSGKLIFSEIKAHGGPIWALECAENSYLMGTGSSDGILKIWEIELHRIVLMKKLKVREQILNIKLLSSRNLIILSGISSIIWAFSLNSLEFKFSLQGHSLPIISSSVCDDKRLFATGSADLSLRIWDIYEKNQKKIIFPGETVVTSITFQPSSINFLSASRSGNIKFWGGGNFIQLLQFKGYHTGPIWSLKFSENGNYLASGSSDKNVVIWKLNNQKLVDKFQQKNQENKPFSGHKNGLKRRNINKNKKIIKKFKTTLTCIYQMKKKEKKNDSKLKNHLIKLFFELKGKYLSLLFKSIKNFEFIIFLNILLEDTTKYAGLDILSNFPEISKVLLNIENIHQHSKKSQIIFKIRKKIDDILKLEKVRVLKIINNFKKKVEFNDKFVNQDFC